MRENPDELAGAPDVPKPALPLRRLIPSQNIPSGGIALLAFIAAGLATGLGDAPAGGAPATQDDGQAGAPSGVPLLRGLLAAYAARPPWHVAGVDYAVGVPEHLALKDPLASPPPGTAVDMVHHVIRVGGSNVVLDGYDFSLHGGYGVYVQAGARDTVITHAKFLIGPNNVVPVSAEAGTTNLTVTYSTFDGGGAAAAEHTDPVWALINDNGSGKFVAKYDWFAEAPADAIDFSNGDISVTIAYNVAISLGHAAGSHPDFVQFVGNTVTNSVLAFNTVYQPPGDGEVTGMQGIQIAAQVGAHAGSVVAMHVAHNTIIAPGPDLTMSCAIAIIADARSRIDGVSVDANYVDARGAYYPFYPPSGNRVSFSENIDMITGRPITLALRHKAAVE